MVVYRSRISSEAMNSRTDEVIPVMRRAHGSEMFSIMGMVATEKVTPIMPEPEDAMPCARLRLVVNLHIVSAWIWWNQDTPYHCARTDV